MKKYLFLLTTLMSTQVSIASPLLEKTTTPGTIPANYAVRKSCVIQGNGVMRIEYKLGNLSSERTILLKLDMVAIKAAINSAAQATINSSNPIADTGKIGYYTYQRQKDGSYRKVVLKELGGIEPLTNSASSAELLSRFIDVNCNDSNPSLK